MFTNNVYVTVNGFPLHGTDSNGSEWIVNRTDGFLDGASSTLATTQKIWSHGVFTNQPFYGGRVVSLEGFVRGTTTENAILSWDALKQALSLDTQDVIIDWRGYKRLIRGKQSGQPLVEWFDKYTLKFSLEFTSNTPFLYSAGGVLSGSTYLPHTNGGMTFPYAFEGDGTAKLSTSWTGTPDASTSTLSQDGQVVATNLYPNPSFEGVVDANVLSINGSSSIVGPGEITPYHGTKRIALGLGNDNRVSVHIPNALLNTPVHIRMMVLGWSGGTTVSAAPNDGKSFSPVTHTTSSATVQTWVPFDIDFTPQTANFWIIFSSATGSIAMDAFGVYTQSDWQAMQALGVDWFDGDTYPWHWVNDWGFPEESTSGSITLNSHGTASSPVIITISGYVVNPRVEHRQTGAALALNYTIPVGETVVLNGETREVLINGKIPSQQIVSSRQWFTAGPGENTFMFSADSSVASDSSAQSTEDLALQNAVEKLTDPTFKNGFDGWSGQWRMTTGPQIDHSGVSRLLPVCDQMGGGYGNKFLQGSTNVPVKTGHVWQLQTWAKVLTAQSGKGLALQLKWYDASGNQHWTWVKTLDTSAKTDWTLLSGTVALPPMAVSATLWLHVPVEANDAVQVLVDSCSLKDISEIETDVETDDSDNDTAMMTVEMGEAWL